MFIEETYDHSPLPQTIHRPGQVDLARPPFRLSPPSVTAEESTPVVSIPPHTAVAVIHVRADGNAIDEFATSIPVPSHTCVRDMSASRDEPVWAVLCEGYVYKWADGDLGGIG